MGNQVMQMLSLALKTRLDKEGTEVELWNQESNWVAERERENIKGCTKKSLTLSQCSRPRLSVLWKAWLCYSVMCTGYIIFSGTFSYWQHTGKDVQSL